jgi:hypothetical protein
MQCRVDHNWLFQAVKGTLEPMSDGSLWLCCVMSSMIAPLLVVLDDLLPVN